MSKSNPLHHDDDSFDGPIGTVITIMGIPKNPKKEGVLQAINEISEAALSQFSNVEIAHLSDTPLINSAYLKEHEKEIDLNERDDELFGKPIGRAVATIMHGVLGAEEREMDNAILKKLEAMSDEERDEMIAARDAENRKWNENRAAGAEHLRQEELANAFDIAEKWANQPDLSKREVAHGVAYDFHRHYAKPHAVDLENGHVKMLNPAQDYQNHFNQQFEEDIKQRRIRAAKELFGD